VFAKQKLPNLLRPTARFLKNNHKLKGYLISGRNIVGAERQQYIDFKEGRLRIKLGKGLGMILPNKLGTSRDKGRYSLILIKINGNLGYVTLGWFLTGETRAPEKRAASGVTLKNPLSFEKREPGFFNS
jgi:hypothetical protein